MEIDDTGTNEGNGAWLRGLIPRTSGTIMLEITSTKLAIGGILCPVKSCLPSQSIGALTAKPAQQDPDSPIDIPPTRGSLMTRCTARIMPQGPTGPVVT